MKHAAVLTACAICLALVSCSSLVQVSGTSGTGNSFVTGKVVTATGEGIPNTQVQMLPSSCDPVAGSRALPADTTDESGRYTFVNIDSGDYNLQAVQLDTRDRAIVRAIHVAGDTVAVPDKQLQQPGAVKVMLPAGVNAVYGYVYIPGTIDFAFLNNRSDFAVLDSVPAGVSFQVAYASINNGSATVIGNGVQVLPQDTTTIWSPAWKYSRKFVLNTSATGANVAGDVANFPVLVKLNSGNFDFSGALSNGADLRFAKPNGAQLPYEIKRWDPAAGRAEIWVRCDTVRGNDSAQSLTMYWGNGAAVAQSNGPAVFGAAGGFEGVWHLGETAGARAADASGNGFTGTYKGGLPNTVTGPIGICQNIARADTDYVDMGNVLNPGENNLSLGVWVKRAAFGTQQAVISKTNGNGPSAAYGFLLSIDLFNFPHFYIASGGTNFGDDGVFDVVGSLAITDSAQWHYLFVSVDRSDNGRCRMYVDGVDRTGTIRGDITTVANAANNLRLCLGTQNNNWYSYKGALGEATVAFAARSADWAKLSYMNQKEQDGLVRQ